MKRLCELVEIEANNKECVVFKMKESTTRLDLIALGCFRGDEELIRMTKGRQPEITLFYKNGRSWSYHFGEGSTTVLNENGVKQRQMIRECAILDFGLVCDWSHCPLHIDYDGLVKKTMHTLSLEDAERKVSVNSGGGMQGHIRVNEQIVALDVQVKDIPGWFQERGYAVAFESDISKVLPCGKVYGTCERLELDRKANVEPVIFQEGELKVRLPHGYLVATVGGDPDYPGIDVEFVSDKDDGQELSRPRVLVEMPWGPERYDDLNIRALVWTDKNSEDYSDEIEFEGTSLQEYAAIDKLIADSTARATPSQSEKGDEEKMMK